MSNIYARINNSGQVIMRNVAFWVALVLRRLASLLERLGATQTIAVQRGMAAHDMVSHPDEGYYLEQYWHWLLPELEERFPDRKARALDVGCGQGRLALPLAEWLGAGTVVGVDLTGTAIEQARHYALERGLTNVEFHEADALEFVRALSAASLDLALMVEVTFFMPAYREVISATAKALKPGGVFFVSFRSQYFDLLGSVRERDWQSAILVRDAREGHWGGGNTWFSWHTAADIRQLLTQAGFSITNLSGIGIASGIEGDPLSFIAQPSKLSPAERGQLVKLETSLAEQYAECGRYILAVAVKLA